MSVDSHDNPTNVFAARRHHTDPSDFGQLASDRNGDSPRAFDQGFSFVQARHLIGDLTTPNARIYWTDFLFSISGGYLALLATFYVPQFFWPAAWVIPVVIVAYVATVLLFMRSVMFIHELVHLPKRGFTGFRIVWNLLCGIPFFIPSFLYYPHVDHHRRKHYGTDHDGEYLSLSHHSRWLILGFIGQAVIIPFLGLFRFVILSPICWLVPSARSLVHRHASTMLVDPFYQREDASPKLMRIVVLQECGCFLVGCGLIFRHRIASGQWFDPFWIVVYGVAIGLLILNEVRTLGAHRWTGDGGEMSFEQQLLDSVNYPHHPWISELWGPIGTRYHALHHLFPRLPYHNLGLAHRRLIAGLPPDSPYHNTVATSLTSEIVALWRRAASCVRATS
ncbi:fatty acid desaturase [Stieleria sp. TO1_6]|uniref:fatty acid desaturase family protein n=1 Tax=Stieleria tagensis TaxID=2956795 RepID=UPI00209B2739|nr:fatty acid desaturase [Stieleria tagensis]MCO8124309.1 fatty acid desaturase [Stieleria tagensis]